MRYILYPLIAFLLICSFALGYREGKRKGIVHYVFATQWMDNCKITGDTK